MINLTQCFFAIACFLLSTSCFGQEKGTSEIATGIGFGSTNALLNSAEEIIQVGGSLGDINYDNTSTAGSLYITYRHAIADQWMLGGTFAYQGITEDVLESGAIIGDVSNRYLTFGIESDYRYISKPSFQMYSGLGVAYTIQASEFNGTSTDIADGDDSYFNFQVTALGFRVGKALAVFGEVGFGYKGFGTVGVSYQF